MNRPPIVVVAGAEFVPVEIDLPAFEKLESGEGFSGSTSLGGWVVKSALYAQAADGTITLGIDAETLKQRHNQGH